MSDKESPTSISSDRYADNYPSSLEVTAKTTSSPRSSSDSWDHQYVARMLWVIGGPVIFIVGLCGNALVIAVMAKRRMRGSSTSVYLRAMAVADSMVLITGIVPEWLEAAKVIVLKEWHQAACKTEKFLFYTSADAAVWILVVFTIDRFVAVCYPLRKTSFCRSSRAKFSCLIVLVAAAVKNVHVLVTRGTQYSRNPPNGTEEGVLVSNCGKPNAAYENFENFVRPWIAFVIVSVVPFCVILVCNVFIITVLVRVRKLRAEHAIKSTSDKSLVQMTAMCLSASFCFLVCVAPSIILLIGKPYWQRGSNPAAYEIAKVVNNQLVFVNHSVNFFLYCFTGRRFRRGIWSVLRCRRHSPVDSSGTEVSFESRTTPGKLQGSSPERSRRTSAAEGRSVAGRSASLGIANVVFKKTVSDLNAASGPKETLARSKSLLSYESVM